MEKNILSYKVFISKDKQTGTGRVGFVAYVPKLGIADDGHTVEEALKNVHSLIKFHLESLLDEGETLPSADSEESFVTSATVILPSRKTITT